MILGQEVKPSLDELAHHGVKGMHWGVRKANATSSAPKISRKQNRQMNKQASADFYTKKANSLYKEGLKYGDKLLVKTVLPGATHPTIVTGKELVDHLHHGGALNVKATEIYARQGKPGGAYILNDKAIGTYKKQDFRNH